MKKAVFEKVTDGIFYLETPYGEHSVGVTLIKGDKHVKSVLIDTGADGKAIKKFLAPAMKGIGSSIRDIGCVLFTHFDIETIGGLHEIRRQNPSVEVIVPSKYYDTVRNPMPYIMKQRARFPGHNPPFQEIMGVFPTRRMTVREEKGEELILGLKAVKVSGRDEGYCWLHQATGTLVCGDALQGNGNVRQGMPYYTDIDGYRESIGVLRELDGVVNTVSTCDMDGVDSVLHGSDEYLMALSRCEECILEVEESVKNTYDSGVTDVEAIARVISLKYSKKVPEVLTYAMQTVDAHLKALEND